MLLEIMFMPVQKDVGSFIPYRISDILLWDKKESKDIVWIVKICIRMKKFQKPDSTFLLPVISPEYSSKDFSHITFNLH